LQNYKYPKQVVELSLILQNGRIPLWYAASEGHNNVLSFLLRYSWKICTKDFLSSFIFCSLFLMRILKF